jgi:hypothetical protein
VTVDDGVNVSHPPVLSMFPAQRQRWMREAIQTPRTAPSAEVHGHDPTPLATWIGEGRTESPLIVGHGGRRFLLARYALD